MVTPKARAKHEPLVQRTGHRGCIVEHLSQSEVGHHRVTKSTTRARVKFDLLFKKDTPGSFFDVCVSLHLPNRSKAPLNPVQKILISKNFIFNVSCEAEGKFVCQTMLDINSCWAPYASTKTPLFAFQLFHT